MKILFAAVPADGHFNPLTAVALDLQKNGHDVRWYAGPLYQRKLAALGIPSLPYDRATEITGENIHELYPERAKLKGPKQISFDGEKFFVANVANHYHDIVDIRSGFDFDAFVCDAGFYAQKLVADKLDVPVYSFAPGPLMATDGVPPPFFGLRPAKSVLGRIVHRGVRAMVHSTLKRGARTYNEMLAVEGISPIPISQFLDVASGCARRVFVIGAPGLDFPQLRLPSNAEFVGPLLPARRAIGADVSLPEIVRDPEARVVAVSQGTVDNADPSKLMIPALEALSDQPYVTVVTTGGKNTAELRERFPQSNVVIEDFLNYDDFLDHVDVFVTNGGFGSVLSAMTHGVPVVTAGSREGKNDINARVAYNGLGINLRTERPSAHKIAAAVRRVIADQEIADKVARLRTELESYEPLTIVRRRLEEDARVAS
jgi:MGT family glycosyltransferase